MPCIEVRPHCTGTGGVNGVEVKLGTNAKIVKNKAAAVRVVVATVKSLFANGSKTADVEEYDANGRKQLARRYKPDGSSAVTFEAKKAPTAAKAAPKAKPAGSRVNNLVAAGYSLAEARNIVAAETGEKAPKAPKTQKAKTEKAPAAKPKPKPKAEKAAPAKAAKPKTAKAEKAAAETGEKRKPSAYNRFVKSFFKANAGASMADAAAAWKAKNGGASPAKAAKPKAAKPKAAATKTAAPAKAPKTKAAKASEGGTKRKLSPEMLAWNKLVKKHWPGYKAKGWTYKDTLQDLKKRKDGGEKL